jgi:CubicO group peptidase (beta-lactamase class C family)
MKTSLLFLLFWSYWVAQAQLITLPDEKVNAAARTYLSKKSGCGLVIGVIQDGRKTFYTYGETTKGSGQAPTSRSLFEIGPVTEGFTTAVLADFVMRGEVSTNDSLARFFPTGFRLPSYVNAYCSPVRVPVVSDFLHTPSYSCEPDPQNPTIPIRLCDLTSHTAGLPTLKRLQFWHRRNPYARYTQGDLYRLLNSYQFNGPHFPEYQYSPLHTALLGHVLSLKAQKTFEQVLIESICRPLNLNDTRISLNQEQLERRLPGHNASGKVRPYWTYDVLAPAGALYSSPEDLLQWVAVHLGLTHDSLYYSLVMTHQANFVVEQSTKAAWGWWQTPMNSSGKVITERYGQTGGFSCYVGFEKSSRTGVVVLSNTAQPTKVLGQEILKSLIELPLSAGR